jgi:flagellar motor switch protein FliN/FliY
MSNDNITDDSQMMSGGMDLTELEPGMSLNGNDRNMDFLLDIPLDISVELGNAKMKIGDLLRLSQGSVVELNRLTDEPLDIFVNKKLMAHGEVVVVNEKFGIRLTNIISPGERVKNLT